MTSTISMSDSEASSDFLPHKSFRRRFLISSTCLCLASDLRIALPVFQRVPCSGDACTGFGCLVSATVPSCLEKQRALIFAGTPKTCVRLDPATAVAKEISPSRLHPSIMLYRRRRARISWQ